MPQTTGITTLLLKGQPTEDKSKVVVKGKGTNLIDPPLGSLTLPVKAQLMNSDTGVCVEATFDSSDVTKDDAMTFKATNLQ